MKTDINYHNFAVIANYSIVCKWFDFSPRACVINRCPRNKQANALFKTTKFSSCESASPLLGSFLRFLLMPFHLVEFPMDLTSLTSLRDIAVICYA